MMASICYETQTMITFGTHYLLTIAQQDRQRVRAFYTTLLGCALHQSDGGVTNNIPPNIDLFEFPGHEIVGVQYVDDLAQLLTLDQHKRGCWMEIKTDDIPGLRQQLLDFGVQEIADFWDPEHFYFHAPGGQVYRLIGTDEGAGKG